MKTRLSFACRVALCTASVALVSRGVADAAMETESWLSSDADFARFAERVSASALRNVLARRGVRTYASGASNPVALTDGQAGERGGEGRVFVDASPAVIAFYFGEPKPVHEVGVYTFNGDARANQDFEVRFGKSAGAPGKKPTFDGSPDLTTGDKVLGQNGGGFHTWFAAEDGGVISTGEVDWVEFRIWRTYNVRAGTPAKDGNGANGWTAVIELEVLGAEDDVIVLTPEQIAQRQALRTAPRKPVLEKKDTWQETVVAAREAIVAWECLLDSLVIGQSGVTPGPWHVIGPVGASDPMVGEIDRQRRCDLSRALKTRDGEARWQPVADLPVGETWDLAKRFGAKPGEVIFLCRDLACDTEFDQRNSPFVLGYSLAPGGMLRFLPRRDTRHGPKPDAPASIVPNQNSWPLPIGPGEHQLLVKAVVGQDGSARLWLVPQPPNSTPGAGTYNTRLGRRRRVVTDVKAMFPDAVSQCQMSWEDEDSIWVRFERRAMSRRDYFLTDWARGNPEFLVKHYRGAAEERLADLAEDVEATADALKAVLAPWLTQLGTMAPPADIASARARYCAVAGAQEALADARRAVSMRMAVEDQKTMFGEQYPNGADYLARIAAFDGEIGALLLPVLSQQEEALAKLLECRQRLDAAAQDILLSNPLLGFDQLLLLKGGPGFSSNWGGPNRLGNEIAVLSPVRPDGEQTTIYTGTVSDMDLSFDGTRILFSDGRHIQEINVDGTRHRQISQQTDEHVRHYDCCRLPDGRIVFSSTACEQAVPCTGGWYVGNLHLMNDDGSNERRLTYDQDHNWNPCVLNNGRLLYARWEYTDTPHYFTRLLFHMNPDGSGQMEYYGSNSYWPNAMYWARPIPGDSSKIVCIVSGHHGVGRMGELLVLDPALGRHEADGVVQRIPGYGKKVEPVIMDGLVSESWPRFATPWPLAEPDTHLGAGKYFLVNCKLTPSSPWGIYLADIFDNLTPLLVGSYSNPIPLRARPTPPVIPDRIEPERRDGLVYMANVYAGPGVRGFPKGSITHLRIGTHVYRYGGNGDTRASSIDGGWDVKRILGTVPVYEDGSAFFRVPANTPLFVQPIDAEGKAQQQMRSWFVVMPGEVMSCVGCHEKQNHGPPSYLGLSTAARSLPSDIESWYGPARGFSFDREVQPVLDRRCVGCHNGSPRGNGRQLPDFRAKRLHEDFTGNYSPAYCALHPYVRRPGYEADYHMAVPAEWQADTSQLVQMLKKGHHNVALTADEWRRIFAWIDFNVPYPANWRESHRPPQEDQIARRVKYLRQYAMVSPEQEGDLPEPAIQPFQAPAPAPPRPESVALDGWPLSPEQAAKAQDDCRLKELQLEVGDGCTMPFNPVPGGTFVMGDVNGAPDEFPESSVTIPKAFYMSRHEVTNAQYALFDPSHDSAYIDARGKDRYTRGYPANEPDQPVVRVTWHQAMGFCRWLSEKTGHECRLPTEAEWEYACRAGTATPWSFGPGTDGLRDVANINDNSLGGWNWGRCESAYSDGARFSVAGGRYRPNAWGLLDMHGNVAEWTLSTYRPYPYDPELDRAPDTDGMKVVRGGSWNDKWSYVRSASRWRYPPYQPVYNVGFRVVFPPGQASPKLTSRSSGHGVTSPSLP